MFRNRFPTLLFITGSFLKWEKPFKNLCTCNKKTKENIGMLQLFSTYIFKVAGQKKSCLNLFFQELRKCEIVLLKVQSKIVFQTSSACNFHNKITMTKTTYIAVYCRKFFKGVFHDKKTKK